MPAGPERVPAEPDHERQRDEDAEDDADLELEEDDVEGRHGDDSRLVDDLRGHPLVEEVTLEGGPDVLPEAPDGAEQDDQEDDEDLLELGLGVREDGADGVPAAADCSGRVLVDGPSHWCGWAYRVGVINLFMARPERRGTRAQRESRTGRAVNEVSRPKHVTPKVRRRFGR
jgi:hypothetical protein